jgi:hypothetical protein
MCAKGPGSMVWPRVPACLAISARRSCGTSGYWSHRQGLCNTFRCIPPETLMLRIREVLDFIDALTWWFLHLRPTIYRLPEQEKKNIQRQRERPCVVHVHAIHSTSCTWIFHRLPPFSFQRLLPAQLANPRNWILCRWTVVSFSLNHVLILFNPPYHNAIHYCSVLFEDLVPESRRLEDLCIFHTWKTPKNPPTPLWRWRRAYWGATATLNAQWHLLI